MRNLKYLSTLLACLLTMSSVAGVAPAVSVVQPWARATAPGASVGAVYFSLVNNGPADELLQVSSEAADRTEMHSMTMQGGEMQMRPMDRVALPAGGQLLFSPGGNHVMLFDLKAPLREGSRLQLKLRFRRAGVLSVDVPVLGLGAMGPLSGAAPARSSGR